MHPADVQDRNGGILVMATLFGMYPFLQKLFADAGYQGPEFSTALAKVRPHLTVETNARLLGSIDVGGSPRIGRTAIAKRWRSCTSPQSGSCLENYAIRPKVFGQTLRNVIEKSLD